MSAFETYSHLQCMFQYGGFGDLLIGTLTTLIYFLDQWYAYPE